MAVASVIGHQIVDLANDTNYYFEVAPQGDSQARYVEIKVLNHNEPYTIQPGSTIILEGKNAGGYNIFNSCSQKPDTTDVIVVPLTNGVLSYAGVGKYQVAIYSGSSYIVSFSFNIVVTEAPYDIVALQASDSYEALNKMVAKAADSNKWVVEDNAPPTQCGVGTHKGDYFLDGSNGNVYCAEENIYTEILEWVPLINPVTSKQLNIMEKTYVRYATDSTGANMSEQPIVDGVVRSYIGFYNTVNLPPSPDINDPTEYKWSLLRFNITNYEFYYAEDTSYNGTPPTTGWSTTLPATLTSNACLWTKVVLDLSDGTSTQYYSVAQYGKDAGFGNITSTIESPSGKSSVIVTMDPSTPNSARDFDFDFRVRGGKWESGTYITGTGTDISSTHYNETNAIPGDMFLNTSTGNIYVCRETNASSSKWDFAFTVGTITNVDDLSNTRRYYGVLTAGQNHINLGTTGDPMYTTIQPTDTWDYYWKCYVSRFAVSPKRSSSVVIPANGAILVSLDFKEQPEDMAICVEVRKIDRPSPTTPPSS